MRSVTEKHHCVPLGISCFLNYLSSLKSYVVVFTFEEAVTSSSAYWLGPRKKHLSPALSGIRRLSQAFFVHVHAPHFLSRAGQNSLRLCAFSWSCKARPGADSLLFAFPREHWGSNLHPSSQPSRVRLASCVCSLAICKAHSLPSGVWASEVGGALEAPVGRVRESAREASLGACGQTSWWCQWYS